VQRAVVPAGRRPSCGQPRPARRGERDRRRGARRRRVQPLNADGTFILSDVRVVVDDALKGDAGQREFVFPAMGGPSAICRRHRRRPGDRGRHKYLLFLNREDVPGLSNALIVRDLSQGIFDVVDSPKGPWAVNQSVRHGLLPDATGSVGAPGGVSGTSLAAISRDIRRLAVRAREGDIMTKKLSSTGAGDRRRGRDDRGDSQRSRLPDDPEHVGRRVPPEPRWLAMPLGLCPLGQRQYRVAAEHLGPGAGKDAALTAAATSWTNVSSANHNVTYAGTTTADSPPTVSTPSSSRGEWLHRELPRDHGAGPPGGPGDRRDRRFVQQPLHLEHQRLELRLPGDVRPRARARPGDPPHRADVEPASDDVRLVLRDRRPDARGGRTSPRCSARRAGTRFLNSLKRRPPGAIRAAAESSLPPMTSRRSGSKSRNATETR